MINATKLSSFQLNKWQPIWSRLQMIFGVGILRETFENDILITLLRVEYMFASL